MHCELFAENQAQEPAAEFAGAPHACGGYAGRLGHLALERGNAQEPFPREVEIQTSKKAHKLLMVPAAVTATTGTTGKQLL